MKDSRKDRSKRAENTFTSKQRSSFSNKYMATSLIMVSSVPPVRPNVEIKRSQIFQKLLKNIVVLVFT